MEFQLRSLSLNDIEPLFDLRNDPDVVGNSKTLATVTAEEHAKWFSEELPLGRIFMICVGLSYQTPVGRVGFHGNPAWIDLAIQKEYRGHGLGKEAVKRLMEILRHRNILLLNATVKEDNSRSKKLFQSLDFQQIDAVGGYLWLAKSLL